MRLFVVLPERWEGLHEAKDPNCWCHPEVEFIGEGVSITHNNPLGDIDTCWVTYDCGDVAMEIAQA